MLISKNYFTDQCIILWFISLGPRSLRKWENVCCFILVFWFVLFSYIQFFLVLLKVLLNNVFQVNFCLCSFSYYLVSNSSSPTSLNFFYFLFSFGLLLIKLRDIIRNSIFVLFIMQELNSIFNVLLLQYHLSHLSQKVSLIIRCFYWVCGFQQQFLLGFQIVGGFKSISFLLIYDRTLISIDVMIWNFKISRDLFYARHGVYIGDYS